MVTASHEKHFDVSYALFFLICLCSLLETSRISEYEGKCISYFARKEIGAISAFWGTIFRSNTERMRKGILPV